MKIRHVTCFFITCLPKNSWYSLSLPQWRGMVLVVTAESAAHNFVRILVQFLRTRKRAVFKTMKSLSNILFFILGTVAPSVLGEIAEGDKPDTVDKGESSSASVCNHVSRPLLTSSHISFSFSIGFSFRVE